MGRKPSRFPGKVDHHPGRGARNFWESDFGSSENKAAARRQAKDDIAAIVSAEMDLSNGGPAPRQPVAQSKNEKSKRTGIDGASVGVDLGL